MKMTTTTTNIKNSKIIKILKKHFPEAKCALNYNNPFELLLATILSAQCTDVQVNKVTPILFKDFPTPHLLMNAPVTKIESIIHSTGFYKNKSKNIIACSRSIVEKFNGEVPSSIAELITLPGVGRKTANVVLSNAFAINEGVVVDTHVKRISKRLELTKNHDEKKIERDLMKLISQNDWGIFSHLLINLGRTFCKSQKPKCDSCPLKSICPSASKCKQVQECKCHAPKSASATLRMVAIAR
ncbi:MAG: endonuclease III [Oligoflexia bacterium]|nr:endonuclease III [Oligoflexia bacterium]